MIFALGACKTHHTARSGDLACLWAGTSRPKQGLRPPPTTPPGQRAPAINPFPDAVFPPCCCRVPPAGEMSSRVSPAFLFGDDHAQSA